MARQVSALVATVLCLSTVLPSEAHAGRWRDCGLVLLGAALVGVAWEEVDYGATRRAWNGVVEWNAEREREAEARREEERQKLATVEAKVAELRKDRKARVAYLQSTFEALLERRNAMAEQNPRPREWHSVNERLRTLQQEIEKDGVDALRADVEKQEAALPKSLDYDADKKRLRDARDELLGKEADLYAELFDGIRYGNRSGLEGRKDAARHYLGEWKVAR